MTVAQRSRAADMIARKGQTVTIAGSTAGTYDTATATATPTAYNKTAKAVTGLPLNMRSAMFQNAQGNVVAGDQQMLLAGLDTSGAALPQPPVDSVVTLADGSTKLTLIAVDPLDPDGEGSIIYDCITRRNP